MTGEPPGAGGFAGARAMAGATVGWAVVEWLGACLPGGYSAYQVVWTRYGVHLLALLLWVGVRARPWRTRQLRLQWLRSMCMIGMPASFILALDVLPSREVLAVFWIAPLLTLAMARLLLGEAVGVGAWTAGALGWGGAWLLLRAGPPSSLRGVVLALSMAGCFAAYLVLTRRLGEESTTSKLFYTAMGVFLVLTPMMPGRFQLPSPAALAIMGAIGLVGLFTLYAFDRAFEAGALAWVAPVAYGQVVWAGLLERLGHGQRPRGLDLGATALIAIAVGLCLRRGREAHPPEAREAGA